MNLEVILDVMLILGAIIILLARRDIYSDINLMGWVIVRIFGFLAIIFWLYIITWMALSISFCEFSEGVFYILGQIHPIYSRLFLITLLRLGGLFKPLIEYPKIHVRQVSKLVFALIDAFTLVILTNYIRPELISMFMVFGTRIEFFIFAGFIVVLILFGILDVLKRIFQAIRASDLTTDIDVKGGEDDILILHLPKNFLFIFIVLNICALLTTVIALIGDVDW